MYRLFEVEDVIAEMDLSDIDDDIAETDEEYQIVISGWWVHIPELNLNLHEGVVCTWEEESQMFMPDFAVTVVYEAGAEHHNSRIKDSGIKEPGESMQASFPADFLYFEQDGMVITLANWLNGRVPLNLIEQMRCSICKE